MKRAVMIGAGQIGRGFIGMLLEKSGYRVTFADVNMDVINDINTRGEYTVHLMDTVVQETRVTNICAINSLDPALVDEYKICDIICTSVGLTALPYVAPAIAQGIAARCKAGCTDYLNVIACENATRGTSYLKTCVESNLNSKEEIDYMNKYVGFPDSAVDRIIPPAKSGPAAEVYVERYHEWDVERGGFKGEVPEIEGMEVVDDLTAYLERKLYTLNGANVVNAAFAYIKGYKTINESLEDPEIYAQVLGQMEECGAMLTQRHGFSPESMKEYRMSLLQRFVNPYIVDDAVRPAREPIRKLSANDRLVPAMLYALSYGIEIKYYYTGVALVMLYNNPDDAQSVQLQEMIAAKGVKAALEEVSGIPADSETAAKVESEYNRLKALYIK